MRGGYLLAKRTISLTVHDEHGVVPVEGRVDTSTDTGHLLKIVRRALHRRYLSYTWTDGR